MYGDDVFYAFVVCFFVVPHEELFEGLDVDEDLVVGGIRLEW